MNNRRNFIKTGIAASAGMLLSEPLFALGSEAGARLKNFGFISGLVKKEMESDWRGTLKMAAGLGFSEIEGGDNFASSPQEFVSYCKEVGIKPVAFGFDFKAKGDALKAAFDKIAGMNVKYAVTYWPWLTGGPFTLEDCKKSAEMLNELGKKADESGLVLLWHNHDREFHEMEEGLPFDYLMENTDPKLVQCEMDIYWVKKGGGDPLEVLKKYAGRIPVLHVKDMAPDGDFICPGRGIIDFAEIFKEARKQGIKHYIVERDDEPDGAGCLKTSARFLKNLRF